MTRSQARAIFAADCSAVDSADGRLDAVIDAPHEWIIFFVQQPPDGRILAVADAHARVVQVLSGTEDGAGAGNEHSADRIVGFNALQMVRQGLTHVRIERVAAPRTAKD